jgi:hypothetical protein
MLAALRSTRARHTRPPCVTVWPVRRPESESPTAQSPPPQDRFGRLRRPNVVDWAAGALALAVYAVVQLAFLLGPQPYDPAYYFKTAVDVPDVAANLFTLRIGLVGPVRAAVLLFGPSEAALYAVPIAAGLALAAAVYATMLLLFHERLPAVAAALVTVLNANYLLKSSSIFPDTVATATFTAGFLCLLLGGRRTEEQGRGWAPTVFVVGAGILFGWTYLIREFSPVLLPAVLAAVGLLRYPLRRVAALVGAALATASLELLYGFLVYREPLVHARLLLERSEERVRRPKAETIERIQSQLDNAVDTIVLFPRLLLAWRVGWVFVLLLALFLAVLVLRSRDRRLWLLAAWCFGFWVVMAVLGLVSLPSGGWIVNVTNIRYWFPIFPPLVMGAFGGLALLVPKRTLLGRVSLLQAATAALAALALVPGFVEFERCASSHGWVNDPAGRWHELRSWFGTPEAAGYDVVWTDGKTLRLVPAYASTTFGAHLWDGRVENFFVDRRPAAPTTNLQRSLVLVHKDRLDPGELRRLAELLDEWSPVFVTGDEDMVVLAHTPPDDAAGSPTATWRTPSAEPENPAAAGTCGRPYVRA